MRSTWNSMIAVIICAGLQAGCGGKEEKAAPPPSGPKAVALAMLRAMFSGDGTAVAAYYDCSAEDKEYMIKTMPLLETFRNVANAGTKAYGVESWEAARDKAEIVMMAIPDIDNAENDMQCTITGKTAICIMKNTAPLMLAKKGDLWLIIPHPSQLPLLHLRGDELAARRKVKTAIDAIIPKVGAKNVSADDICTEIKKAMSGQ